MISIGDVVELSNRENYQNRPPYKIATVIAIGKMDGTVIVDISLNKNRDIYNTNEIRLALTHEYILKRQLETLS